MFCRNTDASGEKHLCEERKWAGIIEKMCLERKAEQLDTILIAQQHRGKGLGVEKKKYTTCIALSGLDCPDVQNSTFQFPFSLICVVYHHIYPLQATLNLNALFKN